MLAYITTTKHTYKIYQFEKADRKQDGKLPIINLVSQSIKLFKVSSLIGLPIGEIYQWRNLKDYKEFSVQEGGKIDQVNSIPSYYQKKPRFPRFLRNKAKQR